MEILGVSDKASAPQVEQRGAPRVLISRSSRKKATLISLHLQSSEPLGFCWLRWSGTVMYIFDVPSLEGSRAGLSSGGS